MGCDPFDAAAVDRILQVKQRPMHLGLIVIGADIEQLLPLLAPLDTRQLNRIATPGLDPVTWVAPASESAPAWITGGRSSVAVRHTLHPVAAALCRRCGHALVSTSANRSGRIAARTALATRRQLGDAIDYIIDGPVGSLGGATPIFDLLSNQQLR